jgi:hypothetical protein
MSCSDKILLWSILGFQGSILKTKMFLSSITIEVENICNDNLEIIKRGLLLSSRKPGCDDVPSQEPTIYLVPVRFEFSR